MAHLLSCFSRSKKNASQNVACNCTTHDANDIKQPRQDSRFKLNRMLAIPKRSQDPPACETAHHCTDKTMFNETKDNSKKQPKDGSCYCTIKSTNSEGHDQHKNDKQTSGCRFFITNHHHQQKQNADDAPTSDSDEKTAKAPTKRKAGGHLTALGLTHRL